MFDSWFRLQGVYLWRCRQNTFKATFQRKFTRVVYSFAINAVSVQTLPPLKFIWVNAVLVRPRELFRLQLGAQAQATFANHKETMRVWGGL